MDCRWAHFPFSFSSAPVLVSPSTWFHMVGIGLPFCCCSCTDSTVCKTIVLISFCTSSIDCAASTTCHGTVCKRSSWAWSWAKRCRTRNCNSRFSYRSPPYLKKCNGNNHDNDSEIQSEYVRNTIQYNSHKTTTSGSCRMLSYPPRCSA
jgi:hypothetical protein